jgi:hypothetical protein
MGGQNCALIDTSSSSLRRGVPKGLFLGGSGDATHSSSRFDGMFVREALNKYRFSTPQSGK